MGGGQGGGAGLYARYRAGIRALPEGPRLKALAELAGERPELADRLSAAQARVKHHHAYFKASGEYERTEGDPDLYKLFCQRYGQVLRPTGAMGVVLPRSVFATKGSTGFRRWLFDSAPPRRIDFLLNKGSWAFDMEPRYSVALLVAERGAAEDDLTFEAAGVAASAEAFATQVDARGLRLRRSALGRLLEVPLLPNQAAADLLAKLRAGGSFALGGGRWRCFPVQGDFNETADRALWEAATSGRPLWKGESFDQFDPHGAGERPCPASDAALEKARKPRPGSGSLVAEQTTVPARRDAVVRELDRARVAFRDVSRATDSRTVRACLVPPRHFLTNKAPYLAFLDDEPHAQAGCLALMNSLPFDWQARRFVEINLNFSSRACASPSSTTPPSPRWPPPPRACPAPTSASPSSPPPPASRSGC